MRIEHSDLSVCWFILTFRPDIRAGAKGCVCWRSSQRRENKSLLQNGGFGVRAMWGRPLCLTENCRHWTAGAKWKPRERRCQEHHKWVERRNPGRSLGLWSRFGLWLCLFARKKNETTLPWALMSPTPKFTVAFFSVNHAGLFQLSETQSLYELGIVVFLPVCSGNDHIMWSGWQPFLIQNPSHHCRGPEVMEACTARDPEGQSVRWWVSREAQPTRLLSLLH